MIILLFTQTVMPVAIASMTPAYDAASSKGRSLKESAPQPRALKDEGERSALKAEPQSATPNSQTWGIELKPVLTEFNNLIGIDHHQPSNKIVLSTNSPSGQPNNFSWIAPDGSYISFSNVAGLTGELRIAAARDDGQGMSLGGFRPGEVFAGTGVPGVIARISPDGAAVQNPWVTLPGETGQLQGGLYVDRTGVFAGDLIAVTTEGRVWRVTASGVPTLLASLSASLAGVVTVPDDPAKYGPWAGKILAGGQGQGTIYAIDPQGNTNPYQLGINPEDIDIIPAHENFYGVDFGSRTLLGAPAEAFSGIIGDILVTQETPGILSHVHWDGTDFQVSQIAQGTQWKQVTFSPAGVGEIPAVKQVYDSIAVVRHAPTLSSGRVEGALWQLSGEGVSLSGNATITSDLLVPGTPTVALSGHPTYQGTIQGTGSTQPTGYTVSMSGNSSLRHVITRTDPMQLETVAAPPSPTGTRDVSLSKANESVGNFATLRNLTLSGKAGAVVVPPGTYGNFNASAQTSFVFGVANSAQPTVYNLQALSLSGASDLQLVGPVILTVKGNVSLSGSTGGAANNSRQLTLRIAEGDLNTSGNGVLYALVRAPQGSVSISGNSRVRGTVACDRLAVSGNGVLQITENDIPLPPINRYPTVDAGPDQTITLPTDTVNLNGTAVDDGLPVGSTLSVSWKKLSGPGVVTFSDPKNVLAAAAFSAAGTYVLRLTASDSLLVSSDTVTITVMPGNQPPTVNAGPDQTITLPDTVNLAGTVSDDALPSGATVNIAWRKIAGPGTVTFSDANAAMTTASFSEPGTYRLELSANDSELSGSDEVAVEVNPANQAPTVDAGADQTVTLPDAANLNGTTGDDGLPAGSSVTVAWSQVSGPGAVTFGNASSAVTSVSFSESGTYVLRLTASDSQLTGSDEITITVNAVNQPPSVNAGPDQAIAFPNKTLSLQGSASDDGLPAGSALSVIWNKVSGPGDVTFSNPTQLATTVTACEPGVYVLRLTASDSQLTSSDEMSFAVGALNTLTLVSGNGAVGGRDADNQFSADGGATFENAYIIPTGGYNVISGTQYISRYTEYYAPTLTTTRYRATFNLPTDFRSPSLSVQVHADNVATILVNGSQIGQQTFAEIAENYLDPAETFGTNDSSLFHPGVNQLEFDIYNFNGPTAFDYKANLTFVTVNSSSNQAPTVDAGLDQVITLPFNTASLNGTMNDDGLPGCATLTSTWSQVSGPGSVTFSDAQAAHTAATFTSAGTYVLRLSATDTQLTSNDDVIVTVNAVPCLPLPSGSVGWWTGDNNTVNFIDGSQGTLRGGAQFAPAMVDQGFKLDGVDDYVEISDQPNLKPANVTAEAWVKFDGLDSQVSGAPQGFQYVIFKKNSRTDRFEGYTIFKHRSGSVDKISFAISSAQGTQVVSTSQTNVVPGQFYHVVGTYDGSRVKLYINGVLEADNAASFPLDYGNRPLFLGATGESGWDGKLKGVIDEAGVFNRALSASEIQSIYLAGSSGKCKIPINRAPTINAGPDQTITQPETANLNGTVSDDGLPAGSTVNTTWSKVSGPGSVSFGNPNVTVSTATFSEPGIYVLRLTATDSELTTSDDLTILVETGACVDLPAGLVGWWPGDNNANDLISRNNGTLNGGATFTTGIANQGFKLDGVDDYVEIPDQPNLKPANVTAEAWVRFDGLDSQVSGIAPPGYQYIVFKKNTRFYQHEGYTLVKSRTGSGDKINFAIASAEGVQTVTTSQTAIVPGQFYYLAGTYDGSRVKLYINGILEDEKVASYALDYGSRPVFIGSSGEAIHDGKLNGVVDEVGIFNRALVASQILSIYLAGHEGKCKPPVNSAPTVNAGPDQTVSLPNGTNSKLYVMNADGSNQTRLTHSTANEIASSWSPDGSKILFASNREGNNELYVMNADGSHQTRLTYHPADDTDPFWSPDGTKITFISNREGLGAVYMMNADGSNVTRVTHNQAIEYSAAWQPRLVQGARVNGDRIAFVSLRDGHPEIYIINPDGTNQTRLTNNPAGNEAPAWSPDGSHLAFSSLRDGNYQIYLMNADGSGQSRLTTGPAESFGSDWSPDGQTIAGGSRRDGNEEIYLTHIAGAGQTRLTNNPATDYVSFWSPDATKIVFSSTREGVYLNGAASDDGLPPGVQLAISWSQISGPGQTTFSTPGSTSTLATFNLPGTYVLRLTASDGELSGTDDVTVIVDPTPANQPPLVDAGQDQTLQLAEAASLRATVSDDGLPSSSPLSVAWSKVSGPGAVTFSSASLAGTTASFSVAGTYVLRLSANDSELSSSDDVTITVNAIGNQPPVVNVGPDQTVSLPDKAVGVFVNDLNGFNTASGSPAVAVDFDSMSAGTDISGTILSGVKFEKGDVPSPSAPLVVTRGADTFTTPGGFYGIIDAATNKLFPTSGENVLSPGGPELAGSNPLLENDDLKMTFDQPVSAVGFDILFQENDFFSAVGITILDPNGNVLYSNNPLPTGSGAGGGAPGGAVFFGFVSSRANIATIIIDEWDGDSTFPDSNIGFDTFRIARLIPGRAAVNLSGTISDDGLPVGGALTSTWSKASGPGTVTFDDPQQRVTKATFSEPGMYALKLTASDSQLTGSDELTVTVNEGAVNNAPVVNAGADQTINLSDTCQLNGTASDDGMPAGSALSVSWSKLSGPGTVTFGNAQAAATSATFSATGTYVLRLTASDSLLTNSDEVVITVTGNQAPSVNAGPDQTITLPGTATINGTATDDGLPAGSTLSMTWAKVSGPGTVSVNNPHAASIIAAFSQPGTYVLRLTASDSQLTGSDDVTITVVAGNQAPTVNAGADQSLTMPGAGNLSGTATDDGLPTGSSLALAWSKVSGPGTVTFNNANAATTTATFSVAGVYVLRLTASDSQLSASDDCVVTVNGVNQAPTVNAGPDQSITLPNAATLAGSISDDGLPAGQTLSVSWSVVSGTGSVTFGNSSAAATTAAFSEAGTYVLRLSANDSDLTAQDEVTVTVYPATPPPTVGISSPADGSEITTRTEFVGSVSNGSWRLEYSLNTDDGAPTQTWIPFASGTGPITNGPLGAFDPTLMLNGTYDVRLVATDGGGQISVTSVTAVVSGQQKVGNFTISFSDLNVPVAGLPIEVIRTYDSRDKRVGDFGVGWTLGIKSVRLEKSGVLGRYWQETVSGGFLPNYCIEASRPHIVTITFPDGKVYKFQAATGQQCQRIAPITSTNLVFTPMPGTHGSLLADGPTDVQVAGSVPGPVDLISYSNPDIFNSMLFHLTTEDGMTYLIDQKGGVRKVTDTNGNYLTIDANGITHSSGKSITFTRDSQGRITQITDPAGNVMNYTYDANGDLVSYKDRENNVTTYGYNSTHYLLTINDPRGIQPIRNEYDENGRLLSHTDAFGKTIQYDHDLINHVETTTDRLGQQTRYEYDANGNVLRQVDAKGGVKTFTYDANDNVLTETNALGKTTTYTYDAQGNRTSVTDPLGNVTGYTYNNLGRVLTITDPLGHVTTNTYDTAGNILTMKDALGKETKYIYSIFDGQLTSATDALGNTRSYEYAQGYLTKETDTLGGATTYTYDQNGNRKSQTVQRKLADNTVETLTTAFEYDHLNRLTKTTSPDGSTTQIEYNSIGQTGVVIDQLGHRTTSDYDELGRLIRTTYADGTKEESTLDAEGHRIKSTDRAGRATTYTYDELGRPVKTTSADGTFTTTTYNPAGQITATTDALGHAAHYEYDAAGRRVKMTNALNQVTTFTYDKAGNQLSMTDANNHAIDFEYDELNRRTKVKYSDATFTTTAYDAMGRITAKTDQAGKTTQFEYDKLGRLVKVTDATGQVTSYVYNEVGQQISQTDALNHTTRFEYDRMGRRTKRTLPLSMSETYTYDVAGNLKTRTDFNGKTTAYDYDLMNRLIAKTPDASFNQPAVTFTYTATGQRQTMTDASGMTTYIYDSRNRLKSKQTPEGTLAYTYDEAGNLKTTRSSNANGVSVDYSYDELHRLATVADNRLPAGARTTTYTYDSVGNLEGYVYPNAVQTTHTFDGLNRLTNLTIGSASTPLAGYAYTLGAAGNRLSVTEQNGRTVQYTYDDLYRLTTESITGEQEAGQNGALDYTYDAVGNRLTRTSTLAAIPSQTSTYDANDRLTSDTYDNNGNTLVSNGTTYSFDWENHLRSVNGGSAAYVYDGDGNRVGKSVSGVTTRYLIDTNNPSGYAQVVDEITGGQVTRTYTYGHDLISENQLINNQWQVSFYGYDGHGSVRLLTDASGVVTDTYTYDAFGNLISQTGSTPNEHLYAGEQLDANLGFYYLRARYMNPASGRFLTMDSFEGGNSDPISLHKYLYANADPTNRLDPSGRFSLGETVITSTIIGALSGAVLGFITGGIKGAIHGAIQGAVLGALVPLTGAGVGTFLLGNAARGVFLVGWGVGIGSAGVSGYSFATATSREERFDAGVSLIASVAFMYFGPKILQRVNTKVITGEQANSDYLASRGGSGEPPWDPSTNVTETTVFKPAKYVRVYTEGRTEPSGSWVMEASEIEGLTPSEIQQKFALPFTPTNIVAADIPAGTTIRIGMAGENAFGPGGGMQVQIQKPQ